VTARSFRCKKKKVVFLTSRSIAPRFQDIGDVSHVALVGIILLGFKSLLPLLLTTSNVAFKSRELIRLRDELFVFRTAKRHMTIEVAEFYVNSILNPYVKSLRDQFSGQSLNVYLVADNYGRHIKPGILTLLQRTGVILIWLLPHISHFLQPMSLAVFGSFKRF
jgi:hypothetical protein